MLQNDRPVRAAGQEELELKYDAREPGRVLGPSEERGPRVAVGPRSH